jgi:flagellar assembly protein FliH
MAKLFDQLHEQALHPAPADLSLELPDEPEAAVIADPDAAELIAAEVEGRNAP